MAYFRTNSEMDEMKARLATLEGMLGAATDKPTATDCIADPSPSSSHRSPATHLSIAASPGLFTTAYTSPPGHPDTEASWKRYLPPIEISEAMHQAAVDHFAAYYASWCCVVNMPLFLADLAAMPPLGPEPALQGLHNTPHYSPLLHNAIFYTGTYLLKEHYPDVMASLDKVFWSHLSGYATLECDHPSLATLRGLTVLAS
jgi:hypothetical protein